MDIPEVHVQNRNFALFFLLLNTWTLAGYRPSLDNTTCVTLIQLERLRRFPDIDYRCAVITTATGKL